MHQAVRIQIIFAFNILVKIYAKSDDAEIKQINLKF